VTSSPGPNSDERTRGQPTCGSAAFRTLTMIREEANVSYGAAMSHS
jgi:hypothetical protein